MIAAPPTLCRARKPPGFTSYYPIMPGSARANEKRLGKRAGSTKTRCRKAPNLQQRDKSNGAKVVLMLPGGRGRDEGRRSEK